MSYRPSAVDMLDSPGGAPLACRRIRVRGQVQGVGFRPFVYRLARDLGLAGWVRNDGDGVEIEVQGNASAIEALLRRLRTDAPPLARVESVDQRAAPASRSGTLFLIAPSEKSAIATGVTPDTTVCDACLAELFDAQDRRYRHPFINCTHCGPRYTLTHSLPYDRANTSMAVFAMCEKCEGEYHRPEDRRFHAQPNACARCGPKLALHDGQGRELEVKDVVAETVERLERGQILAIKGLGGFHLLCNARDAEAVARLRQRKDREEKPLALMLLNAASAAPWVALGDQDSRVLTSVERPIVLLRKKSRADAQFPGVAPGLAWLGVMLPYTPLHYLLFHESAGRPAGTDWLRRPHPMILVCTSANPKGEPLVTDNEEAFQRLADIADAFVVHDRDVIARCDDSVVRSTASKPTFVRRARGYTPQAIRLPGSGPSVLAFGGWFKNTVCLTRGDEAFVSQHIGDLDNVATCRALESTLRHLTQVLAIEPERVAHDLHPDFFSTRLARQFAKERRLPAVAVQHHHAHVAAVMAEHGLTDPVLGLALDGVGLGTDGTAWGGELLRVDDNGFSRVGHLAPLPLPGGDRAAREPWRMAAAVLHLLGRGAEIPQRFSYSGAAPVAEMLAHGVQCPTTTSAGRLFDAASGLLGVKPFMRFEGQAAMLLEGLAERHGAVEADSGGYSIGSDGTLSLLPVLERLVDAQDGEAAAALFHATLAEGLAAWTLGVAAGAGVSHVVLAGGCFLNHILLTRVSRRLAQAGLRVHTARRLPPGDGGLALGQAWVASRLPRQACS